LKRKPETNNIHIQDGKGVAMRNIFRDICEAEAGIMSDFKKNGTPIMEGR